jgi:hypothetical protein
LEFIVNISVINDNITGSTNDLLIADIYDSGSIFCVAASLTKSGKNNRTNAVDNEIPIIFPDVLIKVSNALTEP